MYYFTLNQTYIFAFAVYGGLIMGLIYDIMRIIRRLFKNNKALTLVLDIIFLIACIAIAFLVLFLAYDGRFRIFPFIGYIVGFCIYMVGISKLFWLITHNLRLKIKK